MSILTSPEPIIVHASDADLLFFDFAAHLSADETVASVGQQPVAVPGGLNVSDAVAVAGPNDSMVQASYTASAVGTYEVLVNAVTSGGRTLHRYFIVKVRDT